jgi:hypothetical protein
MAAHAAAVLTLSWASIVVDAPVVRLQADELADQSRDVVETLFSCLAAWA